VGGGGLGVTVGRGVSVLVGELLGSGLACGKLVGVIWTTAVAPVPQLVSKTPSTGSSASHRALGREKESSFRTVLNP
jgi:hypothetical protein